MGVVLRGRGIALAAVVAGLAVGAAPAGAADFDVINTNDAGAGSLREAMAASNANGSTEADQITITATGIVNLQSQLPNLFTPVTITGPGPASLTVRRQTGNYPIFDLLAADASHTLRLEGITIADGDTGISVSNGPGQIQIDRVWVRSNVGLQPPGINISGGNVSITNSTISANQGTFGGGISASGGASVGVSNTTIANNSVSAHGGGIYIEGLTSSIAVSSSTIVGNTANSNNDAVGDGGGAYNNASGGAPFGSFRVANTIIAGNRIGSASPTQNQCFGTTHPFRSYGYNLRSAADPNCQGFDHPTDLVNPNPLLGSLADNGGPTQTIALLPGSPAIDGGYTSVSPIPVVGPCPSTDQRGLPRGGAAGPCDRGAFELQRPPAPATPSNAFTFKLKRRTLIVNVESAGDVQVTDAGARPAGTNAAAAAKRRLKPSSGSGGPGTIEVRLRLTKGAKRKLRRSGKVKANARIDFTPRGGALNSQTARLKIKK